MNRRGLKKAAKQIRLLRIVSRVNRAAGFVRAATAALSLLLLLANVLAVIKMIPER